MLLQERLDFILNVLKKDGSIRAAEIAEKCDASMETVRRDLCMLEKQGKLRRVHGGAMPVRTPNADFKVRSEENRLEKQQAAKAACALIPDGSIIALDSGTTTLEMAKILSTTDLSLTVLTNSVASYSVLSRNANIRTVLTGGEYNRDEEALWGAITESNIRSMHVDIAFICPSYISEDFGLTESYNEIVQVQRAYLSVCDRAVFVANSSKFDRAALYKLMPVEKGMLIAADASLSPQLRARYEKRGVEFVTGETKDV